MYKFNGVDEYHPDLQVWTQDLDGKYLPVDNYEKYISMDSHRKYEYKSNPKEYSIQTISVEPGDVILVHVSEDLDLNSINQIFKELEKSFPDNNILIANEHILKGLTILRLPTPNTGEVNMFDKEIGAPNFLENWLKKYIED